MTSIIHRRLRTPDLRQAALESEFLTRLSDALSDGTCPAGCYGATAMLLYTGACLLVPKDCADAFVCWLRALCGPYFDQLVRLEFTPDVKESA